jgi:hypothetical protein
MYMWTSRDAHAALLVAALGVAAYANGLHGDWLDDDPVAITQNPDVPCSRDASFWRHDFWGTPLDSEASHLSYRPLTILSFRVQHCVVGFHAASFHAVNVALHAAVSALVGCACAPPAAVLPRRAQRFFAGALFALHAVHVEAVTNTVGRAELLSALLFLIAVMLHGRAFAPQLAAATASRSAPRRRAVPSCSRLLRQHVKGYLALGAALLLAACAMLCKEAGLTALLACAALDVVRFAVRMQDARSASIHSHHAVVAECRTASIGSNRDSLDSTRAPIASHRAALATAARRAGAAGLLVRLLMLAAGASALLWARLSLINGWRSPQFTAADNSAAFCETAACRGLSYSYLHWVALRLLLLPLNLAHDWSAASKPTLTITDRPIAPVWPPSMAASLAR